jgi:hypothetical protein
VATRLGRFNQNTAAGVRPREYVEIQEDKVKTQLYSISGN